jgi:hypothetical protein
MKKIANVLGIILIVLGVLGLVYQGYSYTKHETVAQLGDVKITADTKENVYFSPAYGIILIVAGVGLVIVSRRII